LAENVFELELDIFAVKMKNALLHLKRFRKIMFLSSLLAYFNHYFAFVCIGFT